MPFYKEGNIEFAKKKKQSPHYTWKQQIRTFSQFTLSASKIADISIFPTK